MELLITRLNHALPQHNHTHLSMSVACLLCYTTEASKLS